MSNRLKKLTYVAICVTICIVMQFFKNTSAYITGSAVNACLIIITLMIGIVPGIILSSITPIISFLITHNPIMATIPIIIPMIIIGNIILVVSVGLLKSKFKNKLIIPMFIGAILKSLFMGVVIGLIIIPTFIPQKMNGMIQVVQFSFSVVQLISALIGSLLAITVYRILEVTENNS